MISFILLLCWVYCSIRLYYRYKYMDRLFCFFAVLLRSRLPQHVEERECPADHQAEETWNFSFLYSRQTCVREYAAVYRMVYVAFLPRMLGRFGKKIVETSKRNAPARFSTNKCATSRKGGLLETARQQDVQGVFLKLQTQRRKGSGRLDEVDRVLLKHYFARVHELHDALPRVQKSRPLLIPVVLRTRTFLHVLG